MDVILGLTGLSTNKCKTMSRTNILVDQQVYSMYLTVSLEQIPSILSAAVDLSNWRRVVKEWVL
jgi:hypothetical protein